MLLAAFGALSLMLVGCNSTTSSVEEENPSEYPTVEENTTPSVDQPVTDDSSVDEGNLPSTSTETPVKQ